MKRFKFTLLSGFIAAVFVFAGIGALALVARAQDGSGGTPVVQAPSQHEADETNEVDETNEAAETDQASEANEAKEADETNESADLQGQATISQPDAEAAALAANPGAKVVKTELDNENGVLAYNVELDNGVDVMVDANSGTVLNSQQDIEANETAEGAETADNDKDQTQTQEEHQSQADDATETPGVEDAAGQ